MATNETIESRKIYRVMVDEATKAWKKLYFLTNAASVDCSDGITVEAKIGSMKGITTSRQTSAGYVLDSRYSEVLVKTLTGTLRAGETTLSWTDSSISSSTSIVPFSDVWGCTPSEVTQSGSTLTLVFPEQEVSANIKVKIYQ